jgi:hypothetical protein
VLRGITTRASDTIGPTDRYHATKCAGR